MRSHLQKTLTHLSMPERNLVELPFIVSTVKCEITFQKLLISYLSQSSRSLFCLYSHVLQELNASFSFYCCRILINVILIFTVLLKSTAFYEPLVNKTIVLCGITQICIFSGMVTSLCSSSLGPDFY